VSRSHRKTPIFKDSQRGAKRVANKKVRRADIVPDGGGYKRLYEQYNICDFAYYYFGKQMPRELRNK